MEAGALPSGVFAARGFHSDGHRPTDRRDRSRNLKTRPPFRYGGSRTLTVKQCLPDGWFQNTFTSESRSKENVPHNP